MPYLLKFMTALTYVTTFCQIPTTASHRHSIATIAPENISETIKSRIDELVVKAFKNANDDDERSFNFFQPDQFKTSTRASKTCADFFQKDQSCTTFEFCCRVACKVVNYGSQASCSVQGTTAALVCLCGPQESSAGEEKAPQSNEEFNECGQPVVPVPVGDGIRRGREANKNAWPWQVSIQRNERHICGGSLINATHVLTAAHCVENNLDQSHQVILGLLELDNRDESGRVQVNVENIRIHPSRDSSRPSYDAALIKLSKAVTYSSSIIPVCLPKREPPVGTRCMMSGWGQVDPDIKELSTKLMDRELTVLNRTQCSVDAKFGKLIDNTMICAGNHSKGGCKGDGGGPLMCRIDGESWELHGITSFSRKGCSLSDPTVFVDVYSILGWIKNNTSSNYNPVQVASND